MRNTLTLGNTVSRGWRRDWWSREKLLKVKTSLGWYICSVIVYKIAGVSLQAFYKNLQAALEATETPCKCVSIAAHHMLSYLFKEMYDIALSKFAVILLATKSSPLSVECFSITSQKVTAAERRQVSSAMSKQILFPFHAVLRERISYCLRTSCLNISPDSRLL